MKAAGRGTGREVLWLCKCDCGNETTVSGKDLRSGHTKSCGCFQREVAKDTMSRTGKIYGAINGTARATHGHSANNARTSTYITWQNMIQRCTDKAHDHYHYYGGRGIRVCDEWRTNYAAFLADMGDRPSGMTLDRIDPDGDYGPDNCRWASPSVQRLNRRQPQALVKTE